MSAKHRIFLRLAFPLLLTVLGAAAERTTHVRVYPPAGRYPANVTVSPSGSVISRSGDSPNLLILDGYGRRELRVPSEETFRVYQSRSAQLWTVAKDGLYLFHNDEWSFHPIAEIRAEFVNYPLRPLRQISLIPAEISRVLILLSDRLIDYDASARQTRILRDARDSRLGQFFEMQEGADESVWISGSFGLAHVAGPVRQIGPQSSWSEFILPDTNAVNSLQRPFELPSGRVTVSANGGPSGERAIVQLTGGNFSWFPIPRSEKIKQAWSSWDNTIWGYSFTSLFRAESGPPVHLYKEPVSGLQYDVALETNGVFWIASAEGLIRHAPHLWRRRPDLENLQSAIHSIAFDKDQGRIWCSSAEGLISIENRKRKVFPWPELVETLAPPRDRIFLLQNGRILIGAEGRALIFNPTSEQFSLLPAEEDVEIRFLGTLRDRSVCAWFQQKSGSTNIDLRRFDGDRFEPIPLPPFTTPTAELLTIHETARGDFWIGTSSGVIVIRPADGTVEIHGKEQGLPNDDVTVLADVGEGRIWCGISSRVYEYSGHRWQVRLNLSDRANSIVSAHGSIWVGTSLGIYRLVKESWILHRGNEGLPATVYSVNLSPSDQVWAATSGGLLQFHIEADPDPPRTFSPLVLDPQTPSTLEPTIISFRGQDKWDYTAQTDLLFAYRLDEGSWTPYSNMISRVFQNLSSGTHILEVRAMDRNGNEAASSSQIEFAVIVPWFQDLRLRAVTIMAGCISLLFAAYALNKHLQLKRSYAEVEKIVAQRTRELERANQELLHSQKMRAIGTMAAGIAHDFNNILSIIKGSAQIIESNMSDAEKIKTRVNRIQTVVEQGTTIVKALLGLGRGNETELKPCDVGLLLHQTRKLLADRFPETVQIHIDVAPDLPLVICSHEVIQQMLLNFILNAVESMGNEGIVTLVAKATSELPSDLVLEPAPAPSYVVVSVEDEGSGISRENLPRIFEPFFTTKAFSSRRGTGLGLSMVYELAKGLSYGLAVGSELGKGSHFSIFLPMDRDPRESGVTQPAQPTPR